MIESQKLLLKFKMKNENETLIIIKGILRDTQKN